MAAAQLPRTMAASDDSMSDLSHSIEDSEPAGSICSNSSSDDAAESSSLAEETMPEPAAELATSLTSKVEAVPELNQEPARLVRREPEETESALELKMDEADNSRHSAIGLYLDSITRVSQSSELSSLIYDITNFLPTQYPHV